MVTRPKHPRGIPAERSDRVVRALGLALAGAFFLFLGLGILIAVSGDITTMGRRGPAGLWIAVGMAGGVGFLVRAWVAWRPRGTR